MKILRAVVPVALVLGACASTGDSGAPASGEGGGSAAPAAALGTFDRSALEATFDTVLSEQDLTQAKRRYTADYRLPLGLEFTVDPADPTKMVETALRLSVDRAERDLRVERAWFRLLSGHQPKVLAWIREQRDEYLARPGPDASIRSMFGDICAGFFAIGAETSANGSAQTIGYFVETQEAHVNCQGAT